ncbi:hypothetical protein [Ascidiaceihabitans sp.]|uniref:hypothetical protein n=1 Tax=Ascidiaceihabitans sp. TaxID=1872644 RepID=UPI0032991996
MTPSTAVQAMIALKAIEVTTAFSEAPGTIRSMGAVETTPSPHPKPIKDLLPLNGSRSTTRFARWIMGRKGCVPFCPTPSRVIEGTRQL